MGRWACLVVFLIAAATAAAQVPSTVAIPTLAEDLAAAAERIGPAPAKFPTVFLVMSVQPIVGDGCRLQLVTNGVLYELFNKRQFGFCDHLPALHSAVWGRARHSKAASALNMENPDGAFATEYVDLAPILSEAKPRAMAYKIETATAIGPEWNP
jgi:hypothetical protein